MLGRRPKLPVGRMPAFSTMSMTVSLGGAGAVENAFGNYGTLAWTELQSSPFEIDQEFTFDHIKEFVVAVVFVPVIFALHYAEAYDGAVHLAHRLVVPTVGALIGKSFFFDDFKRLVKILRRVS
jgi:hypothetical protein